MADDARRARPEFLYEPRREIQTYRWILPFAPSGTATWYGAVVNPTTRRYLLFLERVDGLELRHVGAFSIWEQTARWIAQFHRSFSPVDVSRLVERSRVLVYDADFYGRWLDRARQFAARRPAVRRRIDRIGWGYARATSRLADMPRTLIHGEFYPCNVLIRRTGHRVRVCPVDWEMAALGPGLMDLACLTTGWAQREQRALIRAYRAAGPDWTTRSGTIPDDFWLDFHSCRLHLAVRMLGWSDTWAPPPHHAHDWLAEAEWLADKLRR
jgi:aminoglycoside phosphotransferase (APT) family kinase protein